MTDVAVSAEQRTLTRRDWLGITGMVIGCFMSILDIQIVASSLRQLSAALGATLDEIAWVQSAYLIAEVIAIPITGWLVGALSTRYLFAGAALAFTGLSLLCAMAWSFPAMIVFRALQGLAGGALIPLTVASVFLIFPPGQQVRGTVLVGLIAILAPITGPVLGGYVTELLSWPWLFLINLPIGLLVTGLVYFFIDIDKPDFGRLKHIDFIGIIFMAVFLGALEFVLKEGTSHDWFESASISWMTAICVVALGLFIWREFTYAQPVVHLRALGNANLAIGCLMSVLVGVGLYGPVYLLPVILTSIAGLSSLQIGKIMVVTGIGMLISAVLVAALEKRLDPRVMMSIGLVGLAIGCLLDIDLTVDVGFDQLFWSQLIRGMFMMFTFVPATTLALGTLPAHEVQNASGLFNLMRNLGGAIGLAWMTWMNQTRYDHHYEVLRAAVTVQRTGLDVMSTEGLGGGLLDARLSLLRDGGRAATALLVQSAQREAMLAAYCDIWLALGLAMLGALVFVPLARKVVPGATVGQIH